jgi:predicted aconitase with swiveling domain
MEEGQQTTDHRPQTTISRTPASGLQSADDNLQSENDQSSVVRRPSSFSGRILVPGEASGSALVLDAPLSLWGGLDPTTGDIIDQRHPQLGQNVTGRVLVLPIGKGSSSASSILLEAVRLGTAPAAILLAEPDAILALGAAVARELYGVAPPVIVLDAETYARIQNGTEIGVMNGEIKIIIVTK